MEYTVSLHVKVRPDTTTLTADEHAEAVARELRFTIGRGLLTSHEPRAIIESYSINVQTGPSAEFHEAFLIGARSALSALPNRS